VGGISNKTGLNLYKKAEEGVVTSQNPKKETKRAKFLLRDV
jgi:hypothetical protein